MSAGDLQIDAMIDRLRKLPGMARAAAPDVARAVESELERQIKAAETPDGRAWEPKKEGSGKPLATAAKSLAVAAIGSRVFARLTGHIARHNLGRAKGGVERQILPTSGIPAKMGDAIRKVLDAQFRHTMGGSP